MFKCGHLITNKMDEAPGEMFTYIGPDWRVVVAEWGADASGRYSPSVALAQHQTLAYVSHSRSAAKGCTYVLPCLPYITTTLMCLPRPDVEQRDPLLSIIKKYALCYCPVDNTRRSYEISTTRAHVGRCKRCIQLRFYHEVCGIYDADQVEMCDIEEACTRRCVN